MKSGLDIIKSDYSYYGSPTKLNRNVYISSQDPLSVDIILGDPNDAKARLTRA
jgi:hypothetical protein